MRMRPMSEKMGMNRDCVADQKRKSSKTDSDIDVSIEDKGRKFVNMIISCTASLLFC